MKGSTEMQAECPAHQRIPRVNASLIPGMGMGGFSLVEMIIAMTLLAIVISVFLLLGVQMTAMTSKARLRDQAVTIAQSEIESRRADPSMLSATPSFSTSVPVSYGNGTINLTKNVSISSSTPSNLFKVVVTVTSSQVAMAAVTMETYILKQ
jgi:prepilin-type N-terminal cleavage/methylation domain-containing protein